MSPSVPDRNFAPLRGAAYEFVGEGLGIPGLPHRVTVAMLVAAPEYGPLLAEAVGAGVYVLAAGGLPAAAPPEPPPAGVVDLADGVDTGEASLAGQALRSRRQTKGN